MATLRILSSELNNTATSTGARLRVLRTEVTAVEPKATLRVLSSSISAATTSPRLRVFSSTLTASLVKPKLQVFSSSLSSLSLLNAGESKVVDPWTTQTLVGTDGSDSSATRKWTQLFGPTVVLAGTGARRTYTVPPSILNRDLVFQYEVNGETATVTHVVTAVTERVVINGVEVPLRLLVITPDIATPPSTSSAYPGEFYPGDIYPSQEPA